MKMKPWNITGKIPLALATLTYLFMWAPAIILMLFSFSNDRTGIRWEGFTLKWYAEILSNVAVRNALEMSLTIAIITVIVSTIAGTLTAYGLYKYKFRGKGALRMSLLLPIIMPYIVTAGALLVFFTRVVPIPLGYPSILVAHISFSTPLAVFVVLGRMQRIDWSLEEASEDLGANKLTTWRKVILPLLMPAIIASAVLIFPWSMSDFTITFFVAGVGNTTLPIWVFSQLRWGVSPTINAIGTIFIILPVIGLLVMNFLLKRKKRGMEMTQGESYGA